MKKLVLVLIVIGGLSTITNAAVFEDDFESDTTGSFPAQWTSFNKYPDQINADVVVVDETTDPGTIYEGDKSLRITFNGGSASGIKTTFDPVTKGILTFYCSIDWASDDLQLMGLHNFSNTQAPGSHLITIVAAPTSNTWEYSLSGVPSGIPVVFDEYARFDLHFDTDLSVATLYINNEITSLVDHPFKNPSTGVTTLRSCDDSGPGTAQWYLDNVSVTPTLIAVVLDIRPKSCFNPLNVYSQGVLPVAILGSEAFDVNEIDVASVRLADVAPFRSNYLDLTGPPTDDPNGCGCAMTCPDGYTDLLLKFRIPELAEELANIHGEIATGDELDLSLTGQLYDETPIEGLDYITVVGEEPKRANEDIQE